MCEAIVIIAASPLRRRKGIEFEVNVSLKTTYGTHRLFAAGYNRLAGSPHTHTHRRSLHNTNVGGTVQAYEKRNQHDDSPQREEEEEEEEANYTGFGFRVRRRKYYLQDMGIDHVDSPWSC